MKTRIAIQFGLVGGIALLALLLPLAASAQTPTVPFVQCAPASSPVTIDGDLSDPAWQEATVLSPFVDRYGDSYPTEQTEVRLLHDAQNLLLAVKLFEPDMSKLVTQKTERDSDVWRDDCVEVMLQPKPGGDFYHFVVNSKNVQADYRNANLSWNGVWQSKAEVFPGGWTVEIALPFAMLGIKPAAGVQFALNVGRERPGHAEYSAWSNPKGTFENIPCYGEVQLVDRLALDWGVLPPADITSAEGTLTLQAAGNPAQYQADLLTYSAGQVVNQQSRPLQVTAGKPQSFPLTFPMPGTAQPGVQLAVKDAAGATLLRTGILPLKVTDASQYELSRAEATMAAAHLEQTPPALQRYVRRWQDRMAELKQNPDVPTLQALTHDLSVAALAAQVPAAERDARAYPFVLPVFSVTTEFLVPPAEAINRPLTIAALRGEYEPAALHLLALNDLSAVTVQVSDLKSGRHVLPAASFDISLLKDWYQAGSDSGGSDTPVYVRECLLKDDSLITPLHAIGRDQFNFDEKLGPVVGDTLKPMDIPAFRNREFWLLLHVPADQAPGLYRGQVEVLEKGKLLARVPIEVTVLPLALEPTDAVFSMCNSWYATTGGKNPRQDAYYEQVLAICARYGMNALEMREWIDSQKTATGYTNLDYSLVKLGLELRKKYGLDKATDIEGPAHLWEDPSDPVTADSPAGKLFVQFMAPFKTLSEQAGVPVYLYSVDEPGYDPTGKALQRAREINELIHLVGMKSSEGITVVGAEKLGANLDLPMYSQENVVLGDRKPPLPGRTAWHYYHPLENPNHDRLLTGLVTWYNDLQGTNPWALASLGSWNDWTGAYYPGSRTMSYIYDGQNKPVPTIEFEAYREGVDDYKYLEMIERRCQKLQGRTLTPAQEQVVADATSLLNTAPPPFAGGFSDVEGRVTAADWAALRARMQRTLVALDAIVNGHS